MRPESLSIIGLGAVGSTLARHAVSAGVSRVTGFSEHRGEGVRALKTNAVHHLAERLDDAIRDAEVVIIARSLPGATTSLGRVAAVGRKDAWVSTIGSLAVPLAAAARATGLESRWAASHHLGLPEVAAGKDLDPKVLPGAVVYVSPAGVPGESAAREVMDLWATVFEAHPVLISAEEHDQRIGWLVHLPVALAAAVGDAYAREGLGAVAWGVEALGASDFEGDPAGQAAALLANREVLLRALDAHAASVDRVRAALAAGDLAAMTHLLEEGRRTRRGSIR